MEVVYRAQSSFVELEGLGFNMVLEGSWLQRPSGDRKHGIADAAGIQGVVCFCEF